MTNIENEHLSSESRRGMSANELKALLVDAFMEGYEMARRDEAWAKTIANARIQVEKDKNNPSKLSVKYKEI